MPGTPSPISVSTKLHRMAELARQRPSTALTTLAHCIDVESLAEAYRRTRKDGAPGVDRQTAEEYAQEAVWRVEPRGDVVPDGPEDRGLHLGTPFDR